MKLYTESPVFGLTKQGEVEIKIRFQPKRLIAISLVLFMHALLLFLLYTVKTDIKNEKKSSNPITLIIEKVAKTADKKIEKKKTEPKPIREKSIKKYTPPVLLTDEQRNLPLPPKVTEEPDMMSMLNAARERRKKAEETAQAENQAAQEGSKGLSAQQIAAANINRSMQQASNTDGTNGVFQIVSKSTRMGMFTFRGWKVNSNGWKQTIEVDAGLGGNIDLAMVRKMIEIIRTHYKADFKWESQRLGRVVTLSARMEDSTELENFMLEEFPEFAKPRR